MPDDLYVWILHGKQQFFHRSQHLPALDGIQLLRLLVQHREELWVLPPGVVPRPWSIDRVHIIIWIVNIIRVAKDSQVEVTRDKARHGSGSVDELDLDVQAQVPLHL